jgi:molybdate transport system substrate-binding protein
MRVCCCVAVLMLWAQGITAKAAEIRVIASPGLSVVFEKLGPKFERATGHTLAMQYGLVVVQKQQIEAGDFDLAIVPSPVLDDAIKQGKVAADTRTPVARVFLGVGIRVGASSPGLASVDAFRRALLDAKSITSALAVRSA